MSVIAQRIWREPAVAVGFVVSIGLLALALATGTDLDAEAIIALAAPFLSALGIRQLVTPTTAAAAGTDSSETTPAELPEGAETLKPPTPPKEG